MRSQLSQRVTGIRREELWIIDSTRLQRAWLRKQTHTAETVAKVDVLPTTEDGNTPTLSNTH